MMENFASFLERVLYDEKRGYYLKKEHPSSNIDYITASSHPIFSIAVEKFIKKNFKKLDLDFLDFGAGDGTFLINLKKKFEKEKIKFIAIEKIKRFNDEEIIFYKSIEDLKEIKGIIFSFELFDSLPFHLVERKNGKLKEIYVENNKFVLSNISSEEILKYVEKYEIKLKEGQRIEVCLLAEKLYEEFSKKLKKGFILTFDYGFKSNVLYNYSFFKKGTLMTHKEKKWERDPFIEPYKTDITCAVNFTALKRRGEEEGLKTRNFYTLSQFIVENVFDDLKKIENFEHPIPIYDLIFGKVGEDVKVLIQEKV